MGDLEATIKGIGVTGTLLYIAMLAYISWRTSRFLLYQAPNLTARQQQLTTTTKKCFHIALFFAALLDLCYYSTLSKAQVTATSFSLHLMALWAELTAFSCIVVVWARVLNVAKEKDSVLTYVIALDAFVLVWTLVVICLVIVARDNVDQWVSSSSQPFILFFLVQALALLMCCLALLYHGIRLQFLVTNHPRWEPLRRERRLRIVLKINTVLSVCTFCFLLRVVLLFVHFVQAEAHQQARFLDPAALVNWYVWCNWVPCCVPALLLLYMMKSGPPQDRGSIGGVGLTLGMANAGAAGTVGGGGPGALREWEEPLVSPHAPGNPLLSRDYWRANLASLYSPPAPPSSLSSPQPDGVLSPAAATPSTPAAAVGKRNVPVLDLGGGHDGDEEQGDPALSRKEIPAEMESEPLILTSV